MPRFPVAFGRRKSTAENIENAPVGPSFRVLDRTEVAGGKSFDGGARLSAKTHHMPTTSVENINVEDNIFADFKPSNRGSGSTNTTKTNSTDNSSRHSNASTAPSSADFGGQEEWKGVHRKPIPGADIPVPPIPKSASSGFLKSAGRSFSFGGQKKHLPTVPAADESPATSPTEPESDRFTPGRARATTTSTATTVVPPKVDEDFNLDLGGDFSKMLLGYDKRASTATMLDEQSGRQALQPRGLTGNRLNQPSPIHIDKTSKIESSPYSWNSQHSNDNLLTSSPVYASPVNENIPPPPVPRHASPLSNAPQFPKPIEGSLKRASAIFGRRKSQAEDGEGDDEEAKLLKDTLSAVNKFMSGGGKNSTPSQGATTRYRRNEDTLGSGYRTFSSESKVSKFNPKDDDDNLFDNNIAQHSRLAQRYVTRKPSPPQNKVMTPAEFERYRRDKERQDASSDTNKSEKDEDDDEEDNYEDDEDEIEKSKQLAKQRRKQEAHMTVYRQQMMKVTGESSSGIAPSRPSIQMSFSTPNLSNLTVPGPSKNPSSENSDEDEEVPLAILAAHGFPNKNRPPTRLSNMASNPNLREATQPSYQRPGSAAGDAAGAPAAAGSRLPPFARRLPQDPYGLVNPSVRESFALGGGAPAPGPQAPLPPGGLVGVIASEERSRALRRGSPQIDGTRGVPPVGPGGFDPIAGIPPQMMYPQMPQMPMLSPGDHAQIQMTQQMQQFMQMQMQFMQMMAANQGGNGPPRSAGHMSAQSMGAPNGLPLGMDMLGQGSFMDNGSMLDLPRPDMHGRTMSMVQPSSASWIQPPPNPSYTPSIRIQGDGYAPSIAPSERSNVGLPGRYRPVSHMPPPAGGEHLRKSSTMSGALSGWDDSQNRKLGSKTPPKKSGNASDDDEEEGWEAMKAKRDKKKSMWKTKKSLAPTDLGALIS